MANVQLAGNGYGGVVQGNYGTYQASSVDGTFIVDTRDAPQMLSLGMTYINRISSSYFSGIAPAAAASGKFVASVALSSGTLSIANQPDVLRPAQIVIGTGTGALTGGSVSITYLGNDGQSGVDVFSAIVPASSTTTQFTSRGIAHISSVVVSGITGGTSPFIRVDSTAAISVPVNPGSADFAVIKETLQTGDETVGVIFTAAIGTITPTTAPNATNTYGFAYTYISPDQ